MVGWRSLLGVRKGFKSVVTCLVVGSLAVLAGLFSLTASKITQHRWFCKNFRDIQPRSQGTQGTLPIRIFSAESNQILRGGQGRQPNLLERDGIAGTVTRSENPSLLSRADVNVPQTIWRTARSRQGTPEFATDLFNSWTKFNPGWDQYFMDDEDVEAFVAAHYNDTVLQAFKDLPLGVMKADLFRYMVMHKYGGVYADMDTECKQPIEHWAPRGCQFSVSIEHHLYFCQWAFASVPGHGILGSILDLVLERVIRRDYQSAIDDGREFVMWVTGPWVFTEGILDYLGVERYGGLDQHLSKLLYERRKEFRDRGVCLLTRLEMEGMLQNHFGHRHQALQSGSWGSWVHAQTDLLKEAEKGKKAQEQEEEQQEGAEEEEEQPEEQEEQKQEDVEEQDAQEEKGEQQGEDAEEQDAQEEKGVQQGEDAEEQEAVEEEGVQQGEEEEMEEMEEEAQHARDEEEQEAEQKDQAEEETAEEK